MQSALGRKLHVGVIMDGNGRWAERRGLSRTRGHFAGVDAVRRLIAAAPDHGIGALTLYAFSSDNWKRPASEVDGMMEIMARFIAEEAAPLAERGARFQAIGRRDRLPAPVLRAIESAEAATAQATTLQVRVAIDFSGRDMLSAAAAHVAGQDRAELARALDAWAGGPITDIDLVIRTSGERRLSDFLLWHCAYAELWFTDVLWPDFTAADLAEAVAWHHGRQRRFGAAKAAAAR